MKINKYILIFFFYKKSLKQIFMILRMKNVIEIECLTRSFILYYIIYIYIIIIIIIIIIIKDCL